MQIKQNESLKIECAFKICFYHILVWIIFEWNAILLCDVIIFIRSNTGKSEKNLQNSVLLPLCKKLKCERKKKTIEKWKGLKIKWIVLQVSFV